METPSHRQCSICLEDFKKPKFIDCFHTFCLGCLRGLENKTPGFINFPLCQREIQLPSGGVDKLITNSYIQDTPQVEGGEIVSTDVDLLQNSIDSQLSGNNILKQKEKARQVKNDEEHINLPHTNSYIQGAIEVGMKGSRKLSRASPHLDPKYPFKTEDPVALVKYQGRSREKTVNNKLFTMVYRGDDGFDIYNQSVGNIVLSLKLQRNFPNRMKLSHLALRIWLSKNNEFIESCDIDYDITFINQKDAEFSTRVKGEGYLLSDQGYPYECEFEEVDLIRWKDALDKWNGFIVKSSEDESEIIFQLRVDISVSNIKKVNFSL